MERNPGNAAWRGSRRRCQDSQMGLSQIPCADRSVPFLRGTSLTNKDNPTLRNDCQSGWPLRAVPTGIPLSRKVGRLSGRDFS